MPDASASPSLAAPSTGVTRAPVSSARSTIRSVNRDSGLPTCVRASSSSA